MRRLAGLFVMFVMGNTASAQDAFGQRRAAAFNRMRDVDRIYLTSAEGRSTYQLGESIPLSVEYSPDRAVSHRG